MNQTLAPLRIFSSAFRAWRPLVAGLAAVLSPGAVEGQGLTGDVGLPLPGSLSTANGPLVIIDDVGQEGVVKPLLYETLTFNSFPLSVSAGDIVFLANASGGDDPSNWAAVLRLFNPDDPTGQEDLPATESIAYFPDVPGGFGSFQLFPNYNFQYGGDGTVGRPRIPYQYTSLQVTFGPNEGVLPGQTADILYSAASPEPGTLSLLVLGGTMFALKIRRRQEVAN